MRTRKVLKQIKLLMRNEYSNIVLSVINNKITLEELTIYAENFPNYYKVLDEHNKQVELKKHQERYKAVVNEKQLLAEKLKKQAEEEQLLIQEELHATETDNALEPLKALKKYNRLRKLNTRLQQNQKTIDTLNTLEEELSPKKRPVGRPRKS